MMKRVPHILRDDVYVLNTTGPGLLSRTLADNPRLAAGINILFPDDVCNCDSWHRFGDYGVHHMDGSWRPHSNILRRLLKRLWRNWNLRRMLADGRACGKTRAVGSIRQTRKSAQSLHSPSLEETTR
jgi:hypothetical protein